MSEPLYTHTRHAHVPRNTNAVHADEQTLNTRLAVFLTRLVGTMPTAYVFTFLAFVGLLGLLGFLPPIVFLLATWLSQQFLQLVFLPILSVGQNVLSRKQELQADEMFATTQHSFSDIEQIVKHLDAQDAAILAISQKIDTTTTRLDMLTMSQPVRYGPKRASSKGGEV